MSSSNKQNHELKATAWIALGSNLGDRRGQLEGAVRVLQAFEGVELEAVSSWLENEAVGGPAGQPSFLNGVLRCRTSLEPLELLRALQRIEAEFGRERRVPDGPRTLDLDLLTYGELRLDTEDLVLPHPRLAMRTFVLEPLAELDPDWTVPGTDSTVRERLRELRVHP